MEFPVFADNISLIVDNNVTIVDLITLSNAFVESAQGQPNRGTFSQFPVLRDEFAGLQREFKGLCPMFPYEVAALGEEDELEGGRVRLRWTDKGNKLHTLA